VALAERWPLGLASSANRPIIDLVLTESGLAKRFRATVSAEEVRHGKPAPDVYLEAARRLVADPAWCVAVEDSSNGLRAAAAAGMGVVAIPNRAFPPGPEALALADVVLESIEALDAAALTSIALPARHGDPATRGHDDRRRQSSAADTAAGSSSPR
jgi:beta-phosphoglucomutase-like phosphatase (HAD superfamily)